MENNKNDSCTSLSPTNGTHSDSVMSNTRGEYNFGSLFKMEIGATSSSSHKPNISEGIYTLDSLIFVWSRILYVNRHFMAWKSIFHTICKFCNEITICYISLCLIFLCLFIQLSTCFMLRF